MRVLHIGKFFPPFAGGIENFMSDLVRACARKGLKQAGLVHQSPGATAPESREIEGLELLRRVPVRGSLSYAPISPAFGAELGRMIEDFQPDLLHLHLPNTSAFWALFDRRARSLPWLVHWHSDVVGPGLDVKLKLLYPAYWPFEQALLRRADRVVATSPPYLQSSIALRRWRGKCRVVPLGLDPGRLKPGDTMHAEGWNQDGLLRVLAVGRLSRYKGFEDLVQAASNVAGVEVLIAGEGDERRRLERLLAGTGAGNVRLLGAIDDGCRNRLLADCDLLCLPSINRAEAFGLALIEAMAAGKPQIATRVPGSGMDWVVEEGRTGWMVTPGDVAELTALLHRLQRDRASVASRG
ncbi:MAG: glycosyltransferase, partial [Wenzhouxiangellaceae bacterium]